jgi:hypothetical protein
MKKKKLVAKVRALEALIASLPILEENDFRLAEAKLMYFALDEGSFERALKVVAEAKTELSAIETGHLEIC